MVPLRFRWLLVPPRCGLAAALSEWCGHLARRCGSPREPGEL